MNRQLPYLLSGIAVLCVGAVRGFAEQPPTPTAAPENLSTDESRLAERFERLEVLSQRLAELSGAAQPQRAALLRDLVARSRDKDLAGQFEAVVRALDKQSFSAALSGQDQLRTDLQQLLDLMLQEDRDDKLDNQRKRLRRYLQDVNRLIRLQRGVNARTEGGEKESELADDQARVQDETQKLDQQIEQAEGIAEAKSKSQSAGKKTPDVKGSPEKGNQPKQDPGKNPDASPKSPQNGKPSDSESSEGSPSSPKSPNGKSPDASPSQGSPSPGKPSGDSSTPPSPSSPNESAPNNPMERTSQRLRQAQQKMQHAQERLKEAQRDGAQQQQRDALEQLQQAKAELERILRQIREEEMERMLVLLEARFRHMLDEQVEIYDETKRLDQAAGKAPQHELEIAGGRLSRREKQIIREADRALVLLREDGTSVAFPQAVEQAREDMIVVEGRLAGTKFDALTQGVEEDVIAALEETLSALQQALKELRQKRSPPLQSGEGQPGEQPLVDQIAELRMIRALQSQVNVATQRFGRMTQGEQVTDGEVLEQMGRLVLRQQEISRATRDLHTKANQ